MDYLLFLQNIRETCPVAILKFMVFMSELCIYGLPMFVCVMYWCVDKAFATVAMINLIVGNLMSNFIKLCFGAYRPWVRDPRIYPAKEAAFTADGYSFPSAHSTAAGSVFTSIFVSYGKKPWVRTVCIASMILIPFARMFLGCHTLEDVLFGLLLGVATIFVGKNVVKLAGSSTKNEIICLVLTAAVCAAMVLIIENKNYPMELAAGGLPLVDPDTMKPSFYAACGIMLGWGISRPLEKHCVNFSMPASSKEALIRGILGVVVFVLVFSGIKKIGQGWDQRAEQILRYSITAIVAGYVYPLSFGKLSSVINRARS